MYWHSAKSRGERLRLSPNGLGAIVRPPRRRTGPPSLLTPEQVRLARQHIDQDERPRDVARSLGVTYKTSLTAPGAPLRNWKRARRLTAVTIPAVFTFTG